MKTYYIESNAALLQDILLNKKWNHDLPEFKTPYTGKIWGREFSIPEEDITEFLETIYTLGKIDCIRLFSKERNHYRPVIFKNKSNPYLYTTFLYKMLAQGECFVSLEEDTMVLNFLERFEIENEGIFPEEFNRNETSSVRGIYCSGVPFSSEGKNCINDIGTFKVYSTANNQTHQVYSTLDNIRYIITSTVKSPYDELFGFPNEKGVTKTKFVEYYIPYKESSVIHFADDIGIIELYNKRDQMELEPIHTFQKDKASKTSMEQDILKTIEEYKKEIVGTSRNRVTGNTEE